MEMHQADHLILCWLVERMLDVPARCDNKQAVVAFGASLHSSTSYLYCRTLPTMLILQLNCMDWQDNGRLQMQRAMSIASMSNDNGKHILGKPA